MGTHDIQARTKEQTKVGLWDGVVYDSHLVMIAQFIKKKKTKLITSWMYSLW